MNSNNIFNLDDDKIEILKKEISNHAFKNLTEKKIKNFFLARKEKAEGVIEVKSLPYYLVIEPTNSCNLACPLCPTGAKNSVRKKGLMNLSNFFKLIDDLDDYCIELALQNWGEPTLNKKLPEMIRYCSDRNIYTVLSTNFSIIYKDEYLENLLKSGLSFLHIDLDGLDQKTYEKYRVKGNVEIVLSNIKRISALKKKLNLTKPYLHCSMLAMSHNEHQLEDFIKMKKELDVDEVSVDKIQINPNLSSSKKWLPKNKELIYESYPGGKASSKSSTFKSLKKCNWPWSGFVINWDGSISPCCIVDDPNADFGNIFNNNIKEIWNNEFFKSSRAEFVDRKKITKFNICNICKNETHSPLINRLGNSFAIKI
jgi:radical SAM protein with 4Fe4S-binding SPASM domain